LTPVSAQEGVAILILDRGKARDTLMVT